MRKNNAGRQRGATALVMAILSLALSSSARAVNDVAGALIEFNDNGAWSWFEDERALVDVAAGKIVVSSVANGAGTGGAARHGDVEVASLDLATNNVTLFTLSDALQADDHNSAALWTRPDGRYLAMYAKHGSDTFSRYRISTQPGDATNWSAEQVFANAAGTTYSNLHYLPADNGGAGRLYNFTRSVGFDPNILVSNNHGDTWSYGGRLLEEGTSSDRPYLRYFSDGQRIHLIATERHPRNYDNSIYHAYVQDGKLFHSNGSLADSNVLDAGAAAPADLTRIFTTGTSFGGVTMRRAWTIDVAIDEAGLPYAVFQARANDSNLDHRFFYARFDGADWSVKQLARAGGHLYSAEDDYTGLAALDPSNPNRLFISTKIDPRNQNAMARSEIFQGITADGGDAWQWTPITFNSTVDNLRPIVPKWDADHTALLWIRGIYNGYTDYDLDIVGLTAITELETIQTADLNRDSMVNAADALLYLGGLHTDLSGLTPAEAKMKGDINGDFKNDYADFRLFKEAYNASQGAGALEALLTVPEPSATALTFAAACFGVAMGRCQLPHRSTEVLGVGFATIVPIPATGGQRSFDLSTERTSTSLSWKITLQ
jgi:hypothetical protein